MNAALEQEFHDAMLGIFERAKKEASYSANRFHQLVGRLGGKAAAKQMLASRTLSEDLTHLSLAKRLDLSMEVLILEAQWAPLFSDQERAIAVKRLKDFGYTAS
ncbi:hypothetical protein GCM10007242_32840 [Pigmentiphaga litoralis]|uniref:hypothetical protein n=1 Tax=Pigmentiphaga litoralis TaxID=516702 RepID=UPI00167AF997|nr:hypothetical protein [Pigmentiphaga litoralis]GGX22900.1 hypothetical protein GCM10007242_32840 [Pigmentiphaga litoralis]